MPERTHPEEGFIKIGRELAFALARTNLSAYESRIVWCIFQKTFGWNKELDKISFSQFEESTWLKRWYVWRTLNQLHERQIIVKRGEGRDVQYGIQKDYDLWQNSRASRKGPAPVEETNNVSNPGDEIAPQEETIDISYRGDEMSPEEETSSQNRSSPIQVESSPLQVDPSPNKETKSSPKEANTKEISNNKRITKEEDGGRSHKITFEKYFEELQERFKDLDFESEYEKFNLYWHEGKRKIKNPKLALLNWMTKAREIKKEQAQNGINRGNRHPNAYPGAISADTPYAGGDRTSEIAASLRAHGIPVHDVSDLS